MMVVGDGKKRTPVRLNRTTGPSSPHRFEACAQSHPRSLRLFFTLNPNSGKIKNFTFKFSCASNFYFWKNTHIITSTIRIHGTTKTATATATARLRLIKYNNQYSTTTLIMATVTPPSTPAHSEIDFDHLRAINNDENDRENLSNGDEEVEEEKVDRESSRSRSAGIAPANFNDQKPKGVRAQTLELKRASLFHAMARDADERARKQTEESLRKKRATQCAMRKTLDEQRKEKANAKEREKMLERELEHQQSKQSEKLDEERKKKERERRERDCERANEAEREMERVRAEKSLQRKRESERAAEFVRKAEEAQEILEKKRMEEKKHRLLLVEAKMAQGDGEGIEKRRVEFIAMEEKRFKAESKKKIEALDERERRERESRKLNDLKWRDALEIQVQEKEQRELDEAIGNMSVREMKFNGISSTIEA